MKKALKDQRGKLSIEQIAWIVIALIVVTLGAAVAVSTMGNKSSSATKLLTKNTLVCPADTMSFDVRPYLPDGTPIPVTSISVGGYTAVAGGPFLDLDGTGAAGSTAEFICVTNIIGY